MARMPQCPYSVVSEPERVLEALHRPKDFSPASSLLSLKALAPRARNILKEAGFPVLNAWSGESHLGIREVVESFFTPERVSAVEPRVRDLARTASKKAEQHLNSHGTVDLVSAVASWLPAVIMFEMLGLPTPDIGQLRKWNHDSMELLNAYSRPNRQVERARSVADYHMWLRALVENATSRTSSPNLFKDLVEYGLHRNDVCSVGSLLLIFGQEATTQLISTALFRLLEGSRGLIWEEARSRFKADAIVRHILLTESSVPDVWRVATRKTRLGDQEISCGEELLLELTGHHGFPWAVTRAVGDASGSRGSGPHGLSFGAGPHSCVGAGLAELDTSVIIQEASARLERVRLHESNPDWIRLMSFQAPRSVVIERW